MLTWLRLREFRRVTSTGKYIPEVDGLRFAAIFSVYLFHLVGDAARHVPGIEASTAAGAFLVRISQILNIGVPFFFIISGYILALPFAEAARNAGSQVSLRQYYLRRLTRLEPPYLLCLVLLFVAKAVGDRGTFSGLWPNLLASSFYLHNAIFARPSDINFVAWSLEIEVQFYLLVPLLAQAFVIRSAAVRRILLAAAVVTATALSQSVTGNARLELSLGHYLQFFLIGFLLVELCQILRKSSLKWDIACVVALPLLLVLLLHDERDGWFTPWVMAVLFLGAFLGSYTNRLASNPWITTIGGMCYSIYLLHNYAIAGFGFLLERFTPLHSSFETRIALRLLLVTPLVFGLSALYFRFVERPFMKPGGRFFRPLPERLRVVA